MTVNQNWESSSFHLQLRENSVCRPPLMHCCIRLQTIIGFFSCLKTYMKVWIPIYSADCFKVVCFCGLSAMLAKISASNIPAKGERFLLSLVFSPSLSIYLSHSVSLHSRPLSLACKAQTDAVSGVDVWVFGLQRGLTASLPAVL